MNELTPDILLKIILDDCCFVTTAEKEKDVILALDEYLKYIDAMDNKIVKPICIVEEFVAELDNVIETQLNEVLHAKPLQTLEATWRGLKYLVSKTETSEMLKIKVLNVTKEDLIEDANQSIDFDQSQIFRKVYEHEYGTLGGEPFICLIGDYEFDNHAQDIDFLEKMSGVAAAAHAPFITAASPYMFGFKTFSEIAVPRDLKKGFSSSDYVRWNNLRALDDSRYLVMMLPHVLMREPYSMTDNPATGLNFNEDVRGDDNTKFCWGNAAYVMAQRITNAILNYNWPCAIRGTEGGGLIEDLPAYVFKTADGDTVLKCPTEVNITDRREKELSDLGFISVCHVKGTSNAVILGAQTVQKPKKYDVDDATANANLSARITYMLAACRFAHFIKAIMRDKVGLFLSANDVQLYLKRWIGEYVLLNLEASQDLKASVPLAGAEVYVNADESDPGVYKAVVFIKPHFQLEELDTSIRLVARIPLSN